MDTKGCALTLRRLLRLSRRAATPGRSGATSRGAGFAPAFLDSATGRVYPARHADGRPAVFHALDGLPDGLVLRRDDQGRVTAVRASVVSGFERHGRFYTRNQAAMLLSENCLVPGEAGPDAIADTRPTHSEGRATRSSKRACGPS